MTDASHAGGLPVPGQRGGETIPPQCEVSGGPGTPLEIGPIGWLDIIWRAGRKVVRDPWGMTAGGLAFHWFVALFPALIPLLGLVSLLHAGSGTVSRLVDGLNRALPPG